MTTVVSAVALPYGLTLSYAEQGQASGPALVLLPGPTDSWWSYEPVLESSHDRSAPSPYPSAVNGDSDKPVTGYRVEDFAADVVPVLDALGIERAVLAGAASLAGLEAVASTRDTALARRPSSAMGVVGTTRGSGAPPRPAVEMQFSRPPPPGPVVAAPPLLAGNALETVVPAAQPGPEVGPSDSPGACPCDSCDS